MSYGSTPAIFQNVTYGGLDAGLFGWIFGDFPLPSACVPSNPKHVTVPINTCNDVLPPTRPQV